MYSRFALTILLTSSIACDAFLSPFLQRHNTFHQDLSHCEQQHKANHEKSTRLFSTRNRNSTDNRDFYAILGISRNADAAQIKQAYRKLAKQYHPDANPGQDTTEKFQEINRAYEVLTDPSLKQKYDMYGEQGIGTSAASDSTAGSPFGGGGYGQQVDLGDIFDSFFGGGGGGGGSSGFGGSRRTARQRGPVIGDDLRFDLEIDFKTAVFGGEEKVRIRHMETCDTCTGNGVKPGAKISTCNTCNGSGVTMQVTRTPLGKKLGFNSNLPLV